MNYASPQTPPGTPIRFMAEQASAPEKHWPEGTVVGPDPNNSSSLVVRDAQGAEWSVHWVYTRLTTPLYGVLSQMALEEDHSTHFYSTPDGKEIEVLGVTDKRDGSPYAWPDKTTVEVREYVRPGRPAREHIKDRRH